MSEKPAHPALSKAEQYQVLATLNLVGGNQMLFVHESRVEVLFSVLPCRSLLHCTTSD